MKTIPIAVQMYTLREECEKDFYGVLERVANLGFDGIELAGYGKHSLEDIQKWTRELNLQIVGSHIPLVDLENKLDRILEEQHLLGSSYIVCPYLEPERRTEADYLSLISFLNEAGEKCYKEGITLCYHHHDFELDLLSDGRIALETIFAETNPSYVQAELDIYWLAKRDESPTDWLKKYQGRTPLVHLKDMTKDEERFFAELGQGSIPLHQVIEQGEKSDVKWWIVEQDETRRTAFESIEISMKYLKQELLRKG